MEKIKLIKIEELKDAIVKNNKPEGYSKEGMLHWPPVVGESFYLFSDSIMEANLRTSTVTEIIDEDTFKTLNSVYKIIRNG